MSGITAIKTSSKRKIDFFSKLIKPKPSLAYDTYWRFAAERQEIFFRRYKELLPPWTQDPVLKIYKFTNAYRASDRVSQYLLSNIIINNNDFDVQDTFFRILLFKLFNKIETWEEINKQVGIISYHNYTFHRYNSILTNLKAKGKSIYSGAYIMASGQSSYGHNFKHENHLLLLEDMIKKEFPSRLSQLNKMEDLYDALKEFPTIGTFLAYQFSIDINYSELTNFSEMDFVKAGPGAKDGIKKCFVDSGDYTEEEIIRLMTDQQEIEFERLGIKFKSLWGRPLQLIDCQNLFCEVDKYLRVTNPQISGVSSRKRIKQKFQPSSIKSIKYCFPSKWSIHPN
jgi:hypothetical protein